MDLVTRTTTYTHGDQSWLASAHGVDNARTIEIDVSELVLATHYADGFVPSGTCLGAITASGKYADYADGNADGTEVMAGHLLFDVRIDADASDALGVILEHGAVVEANLPTNSGIDAAGKTDVAGSLRYV